MVNLIASDCCYFIHSFNFFSLLFLFYSILYFIQQCETFYTLASSSIPPICLLIHHLLPPTSVWGKYLLLYFHCKRIRFHLILFRNIFLLPYSPRNMAEAFFSSIFTLYTTERKKGKVHFVVVILLIFVSFCANHHNFFLFFFRQKEILFWSCRIKVVTLILFVFN